MGYRRHHAIIVSASYGNTLGLARSKALDLGMIVSPIMNSPSNCVATFMVAPDGSKQDWEDSDVGDKRRADFIDWMDAQRYEDGSGPLTWVEVQYGDAKGKNAVVAHSDEPNRVKPGSLPSDGSVSLMPSETVDLRAISALVRNKGRSKIESAGFNGEMGDGGGSAIIREADAFDAGLDGRLPDDWKSYAAEHTRLVDPEYPDYQRMKAKFEGK